MRAARVHKPGPPDVIVVEDIDVPKPRAQEVLVRIYAAGVGPWDALVRTGKSSLPLPYPVTLGSEISGVVEKLGPNTDGFAVGAEVFGATNPLFINAYAEYAIATAKMIARRAANLSHLGAAGVQSDYFIVDVNKDQLTQLAQRHERQESTIPVGSILPLADAVAAHTNAEKSSSK